MVVFNYEKIVVFFIFSIFSDREFADGNAGPFYRNARNGFTSAE